MTRKNTAKATGKGLGRLAPQGTVMVCVKKMPDGSFHTVSAINGGACPIGYTLSQPLKTATAASLTGAAKRRKPSVKKACRTLIAQEGVKRDGTLKKGYRYAKGGRVVRAKAAR